MPRPLRDDVLPPDESCFAHLYNRCVQGTYLCGIDPATGKDYSHRKKWIVQRLEQLASVYLIDILAFAVLDNHLHVVVRTLPDEVKKLTDRQVRSVGSRSTRGGCSMSSYASSRPKPKSNNSLPIRKRLSKSDGISRRLRPS
jgi:hypothetical protein